MIKTCVLIALLGVSARDYVTSGNAAYHAGRYREAIAAYRSALAVSPDAAEAWFDLGDALYRQGELTEAERYWEQASRASNNRRFIARCRYNQGNAIYRRATALSSQNVEHAIAALNQAVNAYATSLKLDSHFNAARYNLDAAREFIRRLKARTTPEPDPDEILRLDSAGGASPRRRGTAEKDW